VLHANQHTFVCVDRRQAKEGLWVNGKPLMVIKPVGGNEQFFDQGNPLFPGLFRSVPKDREKREQRKWPTPRAGKVAGDSVARFKRAKSEGLVHTPPLETAVWMAESTRFPTPLKNDYKGVGPLGSKSHFHKLTRKTNICALAQESVQQTGKLNPDWVERVMGFEFGYTKTEGPPQREPFMDWGHLKPLNQISAWECNVPRVITKGGKNRTKRIKVLGNAVVPAVAHKFMKTILNNQQQGD
jgi:site-specific DNA-cytosine methylase